ncbi:hypothetical protein ACSBR2_032779 [Camellia fascicularis]
MGDNMSKLTSQLGFMDNLQICPEGYKPRCLKKCNDLWKDHKSKIKNKYYKPFKSHPNNKDMVPP